MLSREDGVSEIVQKYSALVSKTPELTSLLYDIDMLPEQTVTLAGAIRLAGLCEVWKRYEANQYLIAALTDALEECGEYFDNRADADFNTEDGFIPNEEMRLLSVVKEALALAKAGRTA